MSRNFSYHLIAAVFFIMLMPATGWSQITVTDSQTAQQLIAVFAGPGVSYANPVLSCPQGASGKWRGKSNLGFDSGIVLTNGYAKTDTASLQIGVNGPQGYFAANPRNTPGDTDLTQLSGVNTFDACKLEFDFIPAYDSLFLDYVFGSEEYDNYSCSTFNDAFAFFISGPGINGRQNIALIPGTAIPVCINSTTDPAVTAPSSIVLCQAMGPGSPFAQYYNDNRTGDSVTYYGLTKRLTATAHLLPGSTYHMKVVVADGGDSTLDSGVFLRANSLRTNVPAASNSVSDERLPGGATIFPNPVKEGQLHISYGLPGNAIVTYIITDMTGRRVYKSGAVHIGSGSQDHVIALPHGLPAASYFLQIESGAFRQTLSFSVDQE